MIQSTKEFKREINSIFGTLKLLVLLFCTVPVIQQIFVASKDEEVLFYNISKMLTFCIVILIIGAFWFIVNYAFKHSQVQHVIEVLVMCGVGFMCYAYTGLYASNYKFIFAVIVLLYALEFGLKFGLLLASVLGFAVILCDTIFCEVEKRASYFQSDFMLFGTFFLIAYIVGFYVEKDRHLIATLNDSANRDSLTGLYNHRFFHEYIHEVMSDPENKGGHFLCMMDIDYFKAYNDTLGHQKGDAVLQKIAEICQETIDNGEVFRYGGEEFVIHMCANDMDEVLRIANRIRLEIADYRFEGETLMPGHNLTVSIGVAEKRNQDDTAADWIERADNALYKAKAFRKNRVQVYSSMFERFDHLDQIDDSERIISIKTLLSVINSRDRYTYNHTDRVVHYCEVFSKHVGLSEEQQRLLLYSAYLHDVGKVNIPQEVLISEKKLTDEQWAQMKKHPSDGADIVRKIKNFEAVADIVEQHHEKYNGSGYPNGLRGNEISMLARVLTLADSFDAMTAKRPYQKIKTFEEAFEEIRRCKETQFDPLLSEMFITAIRETYC
jgi:diguanylate cyclase (GGDEF)-like protein/putative nucleotidyltransferase with HDIG domain